MSQLDRSRRDFARHLAFPGAPNGNPYAPKPF